VKPLAGLPQTPNDFRQLTRSAFKSGDKTFEIVEVSRQILFASKRAVEPFSFSGSSIGVEKSLGEEFFRFSW
jgi:hypothetical protein